jgi:hypothetical protein
MSDFVVTSTTDSAEKVIEAQGGLEMREEVVQEEVQKLGEGAEEKQEEEHPRKKGGFQKRIEKLVSEKRELEAKVARLEAPVAKTEEAQKSGAPDPLFFDTQAEFLAALVKYTREEDRKAALEETKQEVVKKEAEVKTTSWQDKVNAAHEAHPDLADLLEEDLPVSPIVNEVLMESEVGGELMYYLASHPKELARISGLGPIAAAKALGIIEDRLVPKEEEKPEEKKPGVKITAAKKPITPVTGGKGSAGSKSPDEMSLEEYRRWRESQA